MGEVLIRFVPRLTTIALSVATSVTTWGAGSELQRAHAGPPLAVTTGSFNTGDINLCISHMADSLRRVGLTNVSGQGNIVGGETRTVTVMVACLQGDATVTRWMVAVTGRDRVESEQVRNNVVSAITRIP